MFNIGVFDGLLLNVQSYNHFQKTLRLAQGEGKIVLSVDVCCIGAFGKMAHSTRPV